MATIFRHYCDLPADNLDQLLPRIGNLGVYFQRLVPFCYSRREARRGQGKGKGPRGASDSFDPASISRLTNWTDVSTALTFWAFTFDNSHNPQPGEQQHSHAGILHRATQTTLLLHVSGNGEKKETTSHSRTIHTTDTTTSPTTTMERLKEWLSPPTQVQSCYCTIIKVDNEYATLFAALAFTFFCTTVVLSLADLNSPTDASVTATQQYTFSYIAEVASDALNDLSEAIVRLLTIAYECILKPYPFISNAAKRNLAGIYEAVSTWLGTARARTQSNEPTPSTIQSSEPEAPPEAPEAQKLEELEYVLLDGATARASQKDKLVGAAEKSRENERTFTTSEARGAYGVYIDGLLRTALGTGQDWKRSNDTYVFLTNPATARVLVIALDVWAFPDLLASKVGMTLMWLSLQMPRNMTASRSRSQNMQAKLAARELHEPTEGWECWMSPARQRMLPETPPPNPTLLSLLRDEFFGAPYATPQAIAVAMILQNSSIASQPPASRLRFCNYPTPLYILAWHGITPFKFILVANCYAESSLSDSPRHACLTTSRPNSADTTNLATAVSRETWSNRSIARTHTSRTPAHILLEVFNDSHGALKLPVLQCKPEAFGASISRRGEGGSCTPHLVMAFRHNSFDDCELPSIYGHLSDSGGSIRLNGRSIIHGDGMWWRKSNSVRRGSRQASGTVLMECKICGGDRKNTEEVTFEEVLKIFHFPGLCFFEARGPLMIFANRDVVDHLRRRLPDNRACKMEKNNSEICIEEVSNRGQHPIGEISIPLLESASPCQHPIDESASPRRS
ncbi:uncharacterized protein MYCFIDRAFT_180737 [Pseudocercospora fijiensis CIRAD86]|uniref:Uncharacterized protein n=1 Tax=Pseudocercospora fijiensis (strain CIRAD86) TaxID=383855 RepID=M2ZCD9_PSEFD|nr:uncharacterized protein MYCFIDRAFT_180737 [Pseudocercospora fijiensis CIRAD86]EME76749.1 hypothetical protein MYCFIDRAFT_180737 [Pseudocercospora fijiensis CIRAD86]